MTDKITLTPLTSLTSETSAINTINENYTLITSAIDNTLSLNGTSPNQMGAALDMNSHKILNVPSPTEATDVVRVQDLPTLANTSVTINNNDSTGFNNGGVQVGLGGSAPTGGNLGAGNVNISGQYYVNDVALTVPSYAPGIEIGTGGSAPTGGNLGAGKINVSGGYYVNDVLIGGSGGGTDPATYFSPTDDPAAIVTALNAGGVFVFTDGTYTLGPVYCTSDIHITGQGHPILIASSDVGTGDFMDFGGRFVTIKGLEFVGTVYTDFSSVVPEDCLVRVFQDGWSPDAWENRAIVEDCSFLGGQTALVVKDRDDTIINNIKVDKTYGDSVAIQDGLNRAMFNNITVTNSGIGYAWKSANTDASFMYTDIKITNFHFENCGRLDPTPTNHKAGLDIFGYFYQLEIGPGYIKDCGGGLELKSSQQPAFDASTGVTLSILIHDIVVEVSDNSAYGIDMIWGDPETVDGLSKYVWVKDCRFSCFAPFSANNCILIAYNNVDIVDCSFDGWLEAIVLDTTNTESGILSGITLKGNIIVNVAASQSTFAGIILNSGTLEDFVIEDNYINVQSNPIIFLGGTTAEFGNITRNTLISASTPGIALSGSESDIYISNNFMQLGSTQRGVTGAGATAFCFNNTISVASSTPSVAGSKGDLIWNTSPAASGTLLWVCTTAGVSGSAVWKPVAIGA